MSYDTHDDATFLEMLYKQYHQRLFSFCAWYIRRRPGLLHNADDFVQETFLDAIEHKTELMTSSNVVGWLYINCKKRCDSAIKRYDRRRKILNNPISIDDVPDLPDTSDAIIQWFCLTEAEETIHMLQERLTVLEKKIFNSYFLESLSLKVTAAQCDVSIDSVRGAIQRIRKKVNDIQRNS